MFRTTVALSVTLLALFATACGSDDENASVTETVLQTVEAPPTEEPTEPAPVQEPAPEPEPGSEPEEVDADASSSGAGDCITVPDVEGEDHQLAQDTMQAAGLYILDEEDATGQGRVLILDRNWTVVSQSPTAGECVSDDTTILLSSKKDSE